MGAYSRGGGLLTISSSRVGLFREGSNLRGRQFEDLRYVPSPLVRPSAVQIIFLVSNDIFIGASRERDQGRGL